MNKREKIMGGLTLVVGVVFVCTQFLCGEPEAPPKKKKSRAAKTQRPDPANQRETLTDAQLQDRLKSWEPLVTYETWGRDPFAGPLGGDISAAAADSVELRLTGIAKRGNEYLALIGDQILKEGDEGPDYSVIEVGPEKAVIRRKGSLITLYIGQDYQDDAEAEQEQPNEDVQEN